jgi:hypothetical protein
MAIGFSDGTSYEDMHDFYLGQPHSEQQAPDRTSSNTEEGQDPQESFERSARKIRDSIPAPRRPSSDPEKPTGEFNIDRAHNVPLIASALTKDGSTPYGIAIDHRVDTNMEFEGKTHDITPFLIAHENAELPVMGDLTKGGMDAKSAYELAHDKVANPTEAAARFAYAAKNNLDPDEFNKAYYSHIAQQADIASQPSDKDRHPDAHTTRYGLDPGTKVAMDLQDNDPRHNKSQFDMPGGFGGGGGGFRMTRAIKPDVMPAANENDPNFNKVTEEQFERLRDRLLGPKVRGTIPKEVMTSLRGLGHLGFDRPSDALNAVRDDIKRGVDPEKNWDIHPEDALMWKRVMDYIKENP